MPRGCGIPKGSAASTAAAPASRPAATAVVCDCDLVHLSLLADALWEKRVTRRPWVSVSSSCSPGRRAAEPAPC